MMYIPKRYGESRLDMCPFCNKQATIENKQGVAVCIDHKDSIMNDMKCMCGSYLDLKKGKWGAYFSCMNCGNINMKKVFEMNTVKDVSDKGKSIKNEEKKEVVYMKTIPKKRNYHKGKEITIRSDDPLYFS